MLDSNARIYRLNDKYVEDLSLRGLTYNKFRQQSQFYLGNVLDLHRSP